MAEKYTLNSQLTNALKNDIPTEYVNPKIEAQNNLAIFKSLESKKQKIRLANLKEYETALDMVNKKSLLGQKERALSEARTQKEYKDLQEEIDKIKIDNEKKAFDIAEKRMQEERKFASDVQRQHFFTEDIEQLTELLNTLSDEKLSIVGKLETKEYTSKWDKKELEKRDSELASIIDEVSNKLYFAQKAASTFEQNQKFLDLKSDKVTGRKKDDEYYSQVTQERDIDYMTRNADRVSEVHHQLMFDSVDKQTRRELQAELRRLVEINSALNKTERERLVKETEALKQKLRDDDKKDKSDKTRLSTDERSDIENQIIANDELFESLSERFSSEKQMLSDTGTSSSQELDAFNKIGNLITKLGDTLTSKLTQNMSVYADYQADISTRLGGSDYTYEGLRNNARTNLGTSTLVTQADYMKSLSELISKGIASDVEYRALMMALGDRLCTTFEVDNAELLRLIRLQRYDSTERYLGLEGYLTELFNELYDDTSYMNDAMDSVRGAILDLSSTLGNSSNIDYSIQKWLGALYENGVSETTVTNLATAVNQLGTGDVSSLSNSAYQTLFTMVANRQDLDYAELLVNGLDVNSIDKLFSGIVDYVNEISTTTNNVVKSQYQTLLGLSRSDIEAISNLYDSGYTEILNSKSNQGILWYNEQLKTVSDRTNIATQVDNALENMYTTLGTQLTDDVVSYSIYSAANIVKSLDLGTVPTLAANAAILGTAVGGWIVDAVSGNTSISDTVSQTLAIDKSKWNLSNTVVSRGDRGVKDYEEGGSSISSSSTISYDTGVSNNVIIAGRALSSASSDIVSVNQSLSDLATSITNNAKTVTSAYAGTTSQNDYEESIKSALENMNSPLKVKVINDTLNVNSTLDTVSEKTKTDLNVLLTSLKSESESDVSSESSDTNTLTLQDLIYAIVNGEINVNVSNNNFDTLVSKALMNM